MKDEMSGKPSILAGQHFIIPLEGIAQISRVPSGVRLSIMEKHAYCILP